VCVRPKVGAVGLLEWLAYLGEAPPACADAMGDVEPGGDVHDLLVAWYIGELERLTRTCFRTDYARVRVESATVRGRVVAGAVARRASVLPRLVQSRRARSPDTPHNRLLAAALDRAVLLSPSHSGATRDRFTALLDAWACVPRPHGNAASLLAAGPWACPPGYGRAVQLAWLLLDGCSLGNTLITTGPAFLIFLAGLWERALRRMAADLQPLTGWSPVPDAQRTRRWHDGHGFADPVRWMTADVILRSPAGARWVLDAKYKRDYGDEARDDRFQVTAYATAFDAQRGSLVYPTAEGETARRRVLLKTGSVGARPVTVDSIELPMAAGPITCREALRRVIARVPSQND
jgi:hypothetical protein